MVHGDFLPLVARGPATGGGGSTRAELPHARGVGPALAYVPDWEMLEQAAGYARAHALCAIEASMFGDRPGWLGARERTSNPWWSLPPIAPACGSGNDCQVRCARGGVRPFTALGARRVTEGRGGGRSEEGWVTVAADQNRSAMPTAPGSGWPFARSPT